MNDLNENKSHSSFDDCRIYDGIERGKQISFILDGSMIKAYEGESVAAAIFATGKRDLRISANLSEKRSVYCGMGVCYECVMTINNIPNTRSCQTFVREGMIVKSQNGDGIWNL
jgi:predicted molibdopterin-dependent oxidoreductase YjgC